MSELHPSHLEIPSQVMQQAVEWFVRLRTEDPGSEECCAWYGWIEADPVHRAAFAQVQQSWDIAGVLTNLVWPTPEELALGSDIPASRGGVRRTFRVALTALAAGIATIAVGLFSVNLDLANKFAQHLFGTERISTERGEQQSAVLADGSRVELGGLTSVAVKFTPERRLIVAGEGESYYRVARDASRPFVVQSGPVSITALGTAFSVRREGESVSVSVSEGRVEVKSTAPNQSGNPPAILRASIGERVRFEEGSLFAADERSPTGAWRLGRLRFEDEPLRVVVASINRYSRQPIEIVDPALAELHFTGTIFDESIDRWLESIEVIFPVQVNKRGARIQIEPAGR